MVTQMSFGSMAQAGRALQFFDLSPCASESVADTPLILFHSSISLQVKAAVTHSQCWQSPGRLVLSASMHYLNLSMHISDSIASML